MLALVLLGVLLVLGAPWALAREPSSAPELAADPPAMSVVLRDGLLSVEARERPWAEVLEAVRRTVGIRLRPDRPPIGSVTLSIQDVPVAQALQRLFGPEAGLVIVYPGTGPGATSAPSEVWVFDRRDEGVSLAAVGLNAAIRPPAEEEADLVEAAERDFERTALEAAVGAPHPDIRHLAIEHLGRHLSLEAVSVLLALTQDGDPETRQRATRALGDPMVVRELVQDDPPTWALLTQVAQTSDEPGLRLLATEALGLAPDP